MSKIRLVLMVDSAEPVTAAEEWAREWLADIRVNPDVLVSAEVSPVQCKRCKEYAVQMGEYRPGECVGCGQRHHVRDHANCPVCELMNFDFDSSSIHFAMRVDR